MDAILRRILVGIVMIAPIAAIGSLIYGFVSIGAWGFFLFVWFGFTGMFALTPADASASELSLHTRIASATTIPAFVLGTFVLFSDIPHRVPGIVPLLAPLVLFIPAFLSRSKRKATTTNQARAVAPSTKAPPSPALLAFSKTLESWEPEQAQAGAAAFRAFVEGRPNDLRVAMGRLQVRNMDALSKAMEHFAAEQGVDLYGTD